MDTMDRMKTENEVASRESRDSSAKQEGKAKRQCLTQRTREPEKGRMEATNAPILPFILFILSIHVPLLPILPVLLLSFSGALVLCVSRSSCLPFPALLLSSSGALVLCVSRLPAFPRNA
jgi:hypothetical protein